MSHKLLTSAQAAELLGVKLPTLYAYVSRGLLRSRPGPRPRERLYPEQDVLALAAQRDARRDPSTSVRQALDFGAPIRRSALTLIDRGRFYYRGRDAVRSSESMSIEEVAALLWRDDVEVASDLFGSAPSTKQLAPPFRILPVAEQLSVVLRQAKHNDPARSDLRSRSAARCGARILQLFVDTAARAGSTDSRKAGAKTAGKRAATRSQGSRSQALAKTLQQAWAPRKAAAEAAISAALVLCADHELNVSSFTARCVASAGTTPYDVVAAGLAALSGFRHGGHSDRVEALFDELGIGRGQRGVAKRPKLRLRLAARLERGDDVPGFGHRLYPQGDPRFPALLAQLRTAWPRSSMLDSIERVADEASDLLGEHPTIDVGLASLSKLLDLGPGGARTLFSLGRTVGWIAHAIEEYERGELIRPRARYTGPMPLAAEQPG